MKLERVGPEMTIRTGVEVINRNFKLLLPGRAELVGVGKRANDAFGDPWGVGLAKVRRNFERFFLDTWEAWREEKHMMDPDGVKPKELMDVCNRNFAALEKIDE